MRDKISLREEVLKNIPNFSKIDLLPKSIIKKNIKKITTFKDEKINVNKVDYYFTNSISRSSKTMAECKSIKEDKIKNITNNKEWEI